MYVVTLNVRLVKLHQMLHLHILTTVVMAEEMLFKHLKTKVHFENNFRNFSLPFDCTA